MISWESFGQAKIVLKIKGEKEILELQKLAKEKNIPTGLIIDNGHTQVAKGTITCCAIGPGIF